jgi:hypothetical protein
MTQVLTMIATYLRYIREIVQQQAEMTPPRAGAARVSTGSWPGFVAHQPARYHLPPTEWAPTRRTPPTGPPGESSTPGPTQPLAARARIRPGAPLRHLKLTSQ